MNSESLSDERRLTVGAALETGRGNGRICVIELWPIWCDCQRCDEPTRSLLCWPYYEEFLRSDDASADKGYVPVCEWCYRWLDENDSKLWLRTPPSQVTVKPHHE